MKLTTWTAAAILVLSPAATARNDDAAKPRTAAVTEGELTVQVERDGRLDSATRVKVRFAPKVSGSAAEVLEVSKTSGAVSAGERLVVLDTKKIDDELRAARESLADATRNLDLAREDARIAVANAATSLERAAAGLRSAEQEAGIWEKTDSANMLKRSELGFQQQQNYLADQKQELAQLEEMYKGTQLASETKDIVLERARRSVKIAESFLVISEDDYRNTREVRHPARALSVTETLRWARKDHDHAQVHARLAEIRSRANVESAERNVRDLSERLAKLEKDREGFQITAPVSGMLSGIDLQPGDTVSANQLIAEVFDPSSFIVRFSAGEEELPAILVGTAARITLTAFPEAGFAGRVTKVALIGSPTGSGTDFAAEAELDGTHAMARIGMRCKVKIEKDVKNVLSIPRSAVTAANGKSTCKVQVGGKGVVRELVLGLGNKDRVIVLEGLAAGDEVVIAETDTTE